MAMPTLPKGAERVALGKKATSSTTKKGSVVHRAGKHAEADYAAIGKVASRKQDRKPNPHNRPQGGRHA